MFTLALVLFTQVKDFALEASKLTRKYAVEVMKEEANFDGLHCILRHGREKALH